MNKKLKKKNIKDFIKSLASEALEDDFDINFTRWIIHISKEFNCSVKSVLKMDIGIFRETQNYLHFVQEEEKKQSQKSSPSGNKNMTFG